MVRNSVVRFVAWLRVQMDFPVRVPVNEHIINMKGERVSATFFAPFDPTLEPFIRVSTGDYSATRWRRGRDNALASILCSVAHELVHYQQWLDGKYFCESEAVRGAAKRVREYAKTVRHP
ncbi:MAG: TPR-repeat-containing protein [Verrucomicrobiales bacterium]|nr:TPR-repeat-containing protein [Verrucomicrobiales bacterium]